MINLPRPSGASAWGSPCTASHGLCQKYIGIGSADNERAEEGTAGHHVCEIILKSYIDNTPLPMRHDVVGTLSPNNIVITGQMFDSAWDYATVVLGYILGYMSVKDIHLEEKVQLDHVYTGMSGTPDCWLYDPQTRTFHVFDFKYGFGLVEVFENKQLILYLSGILKLFPNDLDYKAVLHIYQPRAYHEDGSHRTWEFQATDIRGIVNQLHYSAHKVMSNEGLECHVGTQCHHCEAKQGCKALQNTSYNIVDVVTGNDTNDLKGDDLANELELLENASKLLEYRLVAIQEQAMYDLKSGDRLTGWGIVTKYGRKRWKDNVDVQEVVDMGDMLEVDLRKPLALDTPTQAIAKLKTAKLDVSIIDEYSEIPNVGFKLKKDNLNKLKQIFGRNNQQQ